MLVVLLALVLAICGVGVVFNTLYAAECYTRFVINSPQPQNWGMAYTMTGLLLAMLTSLSIALLPLPQLTDPTGMVVYGGVVTVVWLLPPMLVAFIPPFRRWILRVYAQMSIRHHEKNGR